MATASSYISIIIPTYFNRLREKNLITLIAQLSLQHSNLVGTRLEIIIVDNGCNIPKDIKRQIESFHPLTRLVYEPLVGLSRARNTGIRLAKGDIIAFLDDDVLIAPTWLKGLLKSFSNKNVLCAGGRVVSEQNSANMPRWYSVFFSRFIVPPKFPSKRTHIKNPYYLIGANVSFRKKVFDKVGLFEVDLGRKGNVLLSGEDTEFIARLLKINVWFEPDMDAHIKVDPNRMNRSFFIRRLFWQGISDYIMVKRRGLNNFYDKDEVFLKIPFLRKVFYKLTEFSFFEVFCMFVRLIGFSFGKTYLERQKRQNESTSFG